MLEVVIFSWLANQVRRIRGWGLVQEKVRRICGFDSVSLTALESPSQGPGPVIRCGGADVLVSLG